ncbi:MAG: hypothetical protein IPN76_31830 [Saprospiraceae bacterium]|nr:hypothetical protein [Saprospiraceae bacterium]
MQGKNSIVLKTLFGDVWLYGGQSNMQDAGHDAPQGTGHRPHQQTSNIRIVRSGH